MMTEKRTLTDPDVAALAEALAEPVAQKLKEQLATELKLEVGGGVIKFLRTWMLRLMIAGMIYFAAVSQGWVSPPHIPHN